MSMGIIACILAAILLVIALFSGNRKIMHEVLIYIMTIQIVGLLRMRAYEFPNIDFSWIMYGFSQLEF